MKKKFLRQPPLGISFLVMMQTHAPRILNVRHFGVEILATRNLFQRRHDVTLFPEDFEVYLFLAENALTV